MNTNTETTGGCGAAVAMMMAIMFIWTMIIVVAWNVGLYGAGVVDNKIGFWTALGLAFCVNILRSIFTAGRQVRV